MLYLYATPQTLKIWSLLPFENLIHLEVSAWMRLAAALTELTFLLIQMSAYTPNDASMCTCLKDSVAWMTSEGDFLHKSTFLMPLSCRSQ